MPGSDWTHEWASTMLIEAMLKENPGIIIKSGSAELEFVQNLILGKFFKSPLEKSFLFDIVSNSRNGIDVDKIDYIQRDCRCMNMPYIQFNT